MILLTSMSNWTLSNDVFSDLNDVALKIATHFIWQSRDNGYQGFRHRGILHKFFFKVKDFCFNLKFSRLRIVESISKVMKCLESDDLHQFFLPSIWGKHLKHCYTFLLKFQISKFSNKSGVTFQQSIYNNM